MKRSKKIFVIVGILFILGTLVVLWDISRKTTFPGSKKHLKESIAPSENNDKDSTEVITEREEPKRN